MRPFGSAKPANDWNRKPSPHLSPLSAKRSAVSPGDLASPVVSRKTSDPGLPPRLPALARPRPPNRPGMVRAGSIFSKPFGKMKRSTSCPDIADLLSSSPEAAPRAPDDGRPAMPQKWQSSISLVSHVTNASAATNATTRTRSSSKPKQNAKDWHSRYYDYFSEVRALRDVFNDVDRKWTGRVPVLDFRKALQLQMHVMHEEHQHRDPLVLGGQETAPDDLPLCYLDRLVRDLGQLDADDICFREILLMIFPDASKLDLDMMGRLGERPVTEAPREKELTDEQRQEIESIFRLYDTDDSGTITFEELRQATSNLPLISRDDLRRIIADWGGDSDQTISMEAFVRAMKSLYTGAET